MFTHWYALDAATRTHEPRLPFVVEGRVVGSVAHAHVNALRPFTTQHMPWLALQADQVALIAADSERDQALAAMNARLRAEGLIKAWRNEPFALFDPASGAALATFERASARFWGALTLGAHATGYVRGSANSGDISHLWIAQRSFSKATDPGLYDNLIGGGVPAGQSPAEALVREGFEEAGLSPGQMAGATAASVLRLHRDIPEGFQHEWLHSFDLELPAGVPPANQDGEVAGFTLMPVADAAALAATDRMTVDAALVTLDFLLRHQLIAASADMHTRWRALRVAPGAIRPT